MESDQPLIVTIAECDGEERQLESVEEARKIVWARMKKAFGPDLEVARTLLQGFTGKASFHDLDASECFDLSFMFLEENREVLKEELHSMGLEALAPLVVR